MSLGDKVPGIAGVMRARANIRPEPVQLQHRHTYVLGALLSAATGKTLAAICRNIWSRLGMVDAFYTWNPTAAGSAAAAPGSRCATSPLRCRLLRDGVIDGTRVTPLTGSRPQVAGIQLR
jgi:CubicO group peptidase (beta-lactamase class C family)